MPTVDELLNNTIESQVCTIDPDTRVINVPACYKEFGVEADEKVNRIKFQCPKIVGDNIDLTTFNLYINYMNARGNYNAYLVDDVTVSGDNITFSWLLSRHVTEKSGTVNYIVCAKKSDDTSVLNEWNTKVATATVGVGLEATTVVEEQNADVIEQILIKLNSSKVQVNYAQNDPNANGYIKNRPFYGEKVTRLRNTYEDWADAGGDDSSVARPILSFIINDEIYKNIAPTVYNGGYTKVYNIPSHEQPKYKVVAYVQNRRIICTLGDSSKEVENWSIYPPEKTEEIHYLDPKYIEDMYYTEKGPVIENLGNTYEDWLKLVDGETTDMDRKVLSFLYDGKLYENVKPTYASSASVVIYTFGSSSSDTVVIQYTTKTISAFKSFSFVKIISKDDIVHKIPEKYYNSNSPFVITTTFNQDTETWAIDRTWDEIKAAVAKSENPSDYVISLNKMILSPSHLHATKNSSGEITAVAIYWIFTFPEIVEENMMPEGFGSIVESAKYVGITCFADKDGIDFTFSGADQTFPVFKFVKVTKSDNGILACNPSNIVELYGFLLDAFDLSKKTSFICPLYYDGETYRYESTEKDSSNVTSIYFSTVSNGIYKRLKITQGQNAPDTVVMDKEIECGTDISLNVTGATVGQTVKISAVDSNGVPTAWVPVDMTAGKELSWIEVVDTTTSEQTKILTISTDKDGRPISQYNALGMIATILFPADASQTSNNGAPWIYPMPLQTAVSDYRYIAYVSSWKTVERTLTIAWAGLPRVGWIDQINSQATFSTNAPDFLKGLTIYIKDPGDHIPAGTRVRVAVLSKGAAE